MTLDLVTNAHIEENDNVEDYPNGSRLVEYEPWKQYAIADKRIRESIKSIQCHLICSPLQLKALSDYLLHKCYFTVIYPVNERCALDLFQSLNATGTPLTAIETFKALVVNLTSTLGPPYSESEVKKYFELVETFVAAN